ILKRDGFSIRVKQTFEEKYVKDVGMLLLGKDVILADEQLASADKLKTIGYLGDSKNRLNRNICNEKGIVLFDDKKDKKRNGEFIPRRMADFINKGDTYLSRNFPGLPLPKMDKAHRQRHFHRHVLGVTAQLNQVYDEHSHNIVAQL